MSGADHCAGSSSQTTARPWRRLPTRSRKDGEREALERGHNPRPHSTARCALRYLHWDDLASPVVTLAGFSYNGQAAIKVAFVLLLAAVALYLLTMYYYDRLLMPPRFGLNARIVATAKS